MAFICRWKLSRRKRTERMRGDTCRQKGLESSAQVLRKAKHAAIDTVGGLVELEVRAFGIF